MASSFFLTKKKLHTPAPNLGSKNFGLKTLIDDNINRPRLHNCINRNLTASHSFLKVDDHPRKEVQNDRRDEKACWASYGRRQERKLPPAIPLLARTATLKCHMPWVLKRTYKNGSLEIKEVPVKHHEYFIARRENGRLTLHLVELDANCPLFCSNHKSQKKKEDGECGENEALGSGEKEESGLKNRNLMELNMLASSMPESECVGEMSKGCFMDDSRLENLSFSAISKAVPV